MSGIAERNREWEMLGNLIAQLARAGATPMELRLLALKGKRVSLRDMARLAARHGCDMSAPRLISREGLR
ncbi:MAG: hypothetical protein IKO55_03470 [Kiritimatiellae bacterium]|nr:hypothetical protein [Kiritimatiellia bacterium]